LGASSEELRARIKLKVCEETKKRGIEASVKKRRRKSGDVEEGLLRGFPRWWCFVVVLWFAATGAKRCTETGRQLLAGLGLPGLRWGRVVDGTG